MEDQPMQQTTDPLHVMDDEELVSRMTIAREANDGDLFRRYRQEVMYRLRRSHIENWTAPKRFPAPETATNIIRKRMV